MKINKLTPSGFCGGVNKALKILDEAIDNPNTPKPIYLLGSIIHNSIIKLMLLFTSYTSLKKKGWRDVLIF